MAERSATGPSAETDPPGVVVTLDVRGWDCLVVGGGPVGTRRALALAAAGATVRVVAPQGTPALQRAAEAGTLSWERRAVEHDDAAGARLVVTATDVPDVNAAVAARAEGALVSRADDAAASGLTFPAVRRRGPVRVAVDTGGRAPAVAAWAAGRVDDALDGALGLDAAGLELLVELVEELRSGGTGVTPAGGDWRSALARTMLDAVLLDLIRTGRRTEAKDRLQACLSSS